MALHPDFPDSPHAIVDPEIRWFPADEALRTAAGREHRSIANMVAVLIMDYCGRNDIPVELNPASGRKRAVKVVDIFGNDTMTIIEVRV